MYTLNESFPFTPREVEKWHAIHVSEETFDNIFVARYEMYQKRMQVDTNRKRLKKYKQKRDAIFNYHPEYFL